MVKVNKVKYRPTRNWKLRVVWWLVIAFIAGYAFKSNPSWFLIMLTIGVVGDEAIKEGYLFKISDLRRGITHERIIAALVSITIIFEAIRRLRDNEKNRRRHG